MEDKKLGLSSVVSTGIGLVVATSCLLSLCRGTASVGKMFIVSVVVACLLNMSTAASLAELNALMPKLTGGLAQYTLVGLGPFVTLVSMVGGYLICNSLTAPAEGAMFSFAVKEITGLNVPAPVFSLGLTLILMLVNLKGVDMFAKIQDIVAFLLIGSLVVLGIVGALGLGSGEEVEQTAMNTTFLDGLSSSAEAFWLFIGVEFIIPIASSVKNSKKNIPLGMFLSLGIIAVIQIFMIIGLSRYVLFEDLGNSPSPHILYGVKLFGKFGQIWIGIISILAAVSTQNSVISSISKICQGMSKMNMLPEFFQKTNKDGAPVVGIIFFSAVIMIIEGTGLASTDAISFLILTASVFWMVSYIITHINVLMLRKRLPKAPRTFKTFGGPLIQIIGIVGTGYMVLSISPDPAERLKILGIVGLIFVGLSVYAVLWIKLRMKMPLFKPVELKEVMAMEHPLYYKTHMRKIKEQTSEKKIVSGE